MYMVTHLGHLLHYYLSSDVPDVTTHISLGTWFGRLTVYLPLFLELVLLFQYMSILKYIYIYCIP